MEYQVAALPALVTIVSVVIAYCLSHAVYNAFLHPLSSFPGPKLWATTYLVRHVMAIRGQLDWSIKHLHDRYGPVVRYSPNEVSFISEQAWKDIYAPRSKVIIKDPDFYGAVEQGPNGAKSLFNASTEQHPIVRKQLSYAFSEKSLRDQEPLMKQYTDLLIQRLRGFAESGAPTDLVSWFKFTTFDMMGDLSIGKPFNCLRDGKYHSWVSAIYASIKIGPYLRVASTYKTLKRLLPLIVPTHLREARARHEKYIKENTMERIGMGVMEERRDFLSYILANRDDGGLTDNEVVANSSLLILAGSDSTASALSGIFYHLLKNPAILQRVADEIRAAFATEDEINFINAGTRLSYTYAVIDEGFRLYPPGPTLAPRRTPHGGPTKIDDQWIPPWTVVGVHALAATRSELNFHRAEEFLPERWLPEHTSNPKSPFYGDERGASQPFGIGPRNCLGQGLAMNQLRTIMLRIIWNFDLTLDPVCNDWHKQITYTLWEKPALNVHLSPRAVRSELKSIK